MLCVRVRACVEPVYPARVLQDTLDWLYAATEPQLMVSQFRSNLGNLYPSSVIQLQVRQRAVCLCVCLCVCARVCSVCVCSRVCVSAGVPVAPPRPLSTTCTSPTWT